MLKRKCLLKPVSQLWIPETLGVCGGMTGGVKGPKKTFKKNSTQSCMSKNKISSDVNSHNLIR